MMQSQTRARELSRSECLALLATAPFGRIVFTDGALPAITTVNFVLDPSGIVLRTRAGSRLCQSVAGAVVAFQADDVDVARRAGWTVTAVGQATVVADPLEVDRLARLPLQPWVVGDLDTYVVVAPGIVTGRRIGGPEPVPAVGQEASATG